MYFGYHALYIQGQQSCPPRYFRLLQPPYLPFDLPGNLRFNFRYAKEIAFVALLASIIEEEMSVSLKKEVLFVNLHDLKIHSLRAC